MRHSLLVLPGDGIGPDICDAVLRCLSALDERFDLNLDIAVAAIGLASLERTGCTMPADLLERAAASDGIVLGPLSTSSYPPADRGGINVSATLRRHFDLFANVRPCRSLPGVSTTEMDLVLVRENSEGFLADRVMASGSGEFMPTPDVALAVRKITTAGSRRIAEVAFDLARGRQKHVTVVHKANSLKLSDGLFLQEVRRVAGANPEVVLEEVLVDAMAALLVRCPERFDVVVTTNLFGDILSNEAAEISGSLGIAPSLNMGHRHAVAQAVHGSADDIAGKDQANPVGLLLATTMLFGWIADRKEAPVLREAAATLREVIRRALLHPSTRTRDIAGELGTRAFTDAIVHAIREPKRCSQTSISHKERGEHAPSLVTTTQQGAHMIRNDIILEDTTLRDGEQSPGVAFSKKTKLAIYDMLVAAGVRWIEAGIPVMGGEELDTMRALLDRNGPANLVAWNRGVRDDVKLSLDLGFKFVHIGLPTSKLHLEASVNKTRDWLLKQAADLIKYAKDRGAFVSISAEDIARTEISFLQEYAGAVQNAGADRLRMSDTIGILNSEQYGERIKSVAETTSIDLQCHAHNDFGLATSNTISGLRNGARYFHVTVNGIGERAGMADIAHVVLALKVLYGKDLGIDGVGLKRLSDYVAKATRCAVPPWHPITGSNIFAHESGIHVNGMLKDTRAFEPLSPEDVGGERRYVLGKHSGRALVRHVLAEAGHDPSEDHVAVCLDLVRAEAIAQSGAVSPDQLLSIYTRVTGGAHAAS